MYKRILVAVDGSDTSKVALAEALELSKVHQSQVRILNVVDAAPLFVSDNFYASMDKLELALVAVGKQTLSEAQATAEKAGIRAETRLVENETVNNRVSTVITQEAQAWPAELIVLGTHGRRGISHLVLGSVAEGVVRAATVPVLLIRSK